MKSDGRNHSPGEKLLMQRVAAEFKKKKDQLGAKKAAKALNVSLASFYNYVAGTDLPRTEVLRNAQEVWGIEWPPWMDLSQILRTRKVRSAEQMGFSFLDAVREEDVEVIKVWPDRINGLKVTVKIRFPHLTRLRS